MTDSAFVGGHQDVQIADGLPAAPVAAGDHDALDALGAFEPGREGLGVAGGRRQLDAMLGAQVRLQGRDDRCLGLGAEARQLAQAPVLGGTVELLRRVDVQIVVQGVDALRTQTRQVKQLGQVRGELLLELLQGLTSTRLEDLPNLTGEGLADAGEACEIRLFLRQAGELSGQVPNLARPVTVGAHAEADSRRGSPADRRSSRRPSATSSLWMGMVWVNETGLLSSILG